MDTLTLPAISDLAVPIYIGFILLEVAAVMWFARKGAFEATDAVTSLLMGLGNLVSKILLGGTILAGIAAVFGWVYQHRLFDMPVALWVFVLAFVLDDFVYYWTHRFSHEVRWAWADHVIHHSSQHYNLTTALRQPWLSFATGLFVFSLPIVWLGVHPAILVFCHSLNLFYQFFIHTETVRRLPAPVEWLMNTPSHHRVHHGKNPKYLDANYGGVFIVWDRLFGTFVPEDDAEPVRYGLVRDIGTFNPLRVATHEYVAIAKDVAQPKLTWSQRLCYMFRRPGWSHDGSRRTSVEIKQAAGRLPPTKKGAPKDAPSVVG